MGWGYQPRNKTKAELALEGRRALVKKFGAGTVEELQAIAAKTR